MLSQNNEEFAIAVYCIPMLPNSRIHHEVLLLEFRSRATCLFHFTIHSIDTLTKFLHQLIGMEIARNLWITREMSMTNVRCTNQSGEDAGTLHGDVVIEYLHLNIST